MRRAIKLAFFVSLFIFTPACLENLWPNATSPSTGSPQTPTTCDQDCMDKVSTKTLLNHLQNALGQLQSMGQASVSASCEFNGSVTLTLNPLVPATASANFSFQLAFQDCVAAGVTYSGGMTGNAYLQVSGSAVTLRQATLQSSADFSLAGEVVVAGLPTPISVSNNSCVINLSVAPGPVISGTFCGRNLSADLSTTTFDPTASFCGSGLPLACNQACQQEILQKLIEAPLAPSLNCSLSPTSVNSTVACPNGGTVQVAGTASCLSANLTYTLSDCDVDGVTVNGSATQTGFPNISLNGSLSYSGTVPLDPTHNLTIASAQCTASLSLSLSGENIEVGGSFCGNPISIEN